MIVYPMNALAEDQLERMRGLLAGSGITFGMYVGKTPQHEREVAGHRLQDVECVHEEYEADAWATQRTVPPAPTDPVELLKRVLHAVDASTPETEIRVVYQGLVGRALPAGNWSEALYDALLANELVYQIRVALLRPLPLDLLIDKLAAVMGRRVSEEELLAYLTLGAAAFKGGRAVFRPVVHGFIRGIPGAVVRGMPSVSCSPSKRWKGSPLPYLSRAIMLPAVASYFSGPTPWGASAVNTLPHRLQRNFSSS